MSLYTATYYNVFAYPTATLPTLEDAEATLLDSIGDTAPHSIAAHNVVRKAIRNAAKLINVEADFPDLVVGARSWSAADISVLQEWVITNCGKFVDPSKIADASGLDETAATSKTGHLDVESFAAHEGEFESWEYTSKYLAGLLDGNDWGFSFSSETDDDGKPSVGRPGESYQDTNGYRTCAQNDYVLTLQLKELATVLEYLYAGLTTFEWTANQQLNQADGASSTSTEFYAWTAAKNDAEINEIPSTEDAAPEQNSVGTFDADGTPSPTTTPPPTPWPTTPPPITPWPPWPTTPPPTPEPT